VAHALNSGEATRANENVFNVEGKPIKIVERLKHLGKVTAKSCHLLTSVKNQTVHGKTKLRAARTSHFLTTF
jgi:hypothetical protein